MSLLRSLSMMPIGFPLQLAGSSVLAVVSVIVWMKYQAQKSRTQYQIPNPTIFALQGEGSLATYQDWSRFTASQRAYSVTCADSLRLLVLFPFALLYSPYLSAIGVYVWVLGRIVYYYGYTSGDPARRTVGLWGVTGTWLLAYCTVRTIEQMWVTTWQDMLVQFHLAYVPEAQWPSYVIEHVAPKIPSISSRLLAFLGETITNITQ
eukprot:m.40407 g.40407  ORF g.40407 m.40407 type:complete len:206 (-) comp10436_c0_seq2:102-719(-)